MQHIHAFNISPKEYYIRGKKNDFPQVDVCPCCSYPAILPRHGFYWRNALFRKAEFRIPILRLKCPSCGKTISMI
jgi:hypothetical protein